jgi:hypothetical protein
MKQSLRGAPVWLALAVLFAGLALLRPLDHDESQYVAAATLSAHGALPYLDYLYLQAPLQPLAFAAVAWVAGPWAWPALRIVNALLGVVALGGVYRAARVAGAGARAAATATALFGCCDILLFSIGTARNDALPLALFALALPALVRGAQGRATAGSALLAGLLLASAASAKVSYAVPALGYGALTLVDRRHRPALVALGAAPLAVLVGWFYVANPPAFLFGVLGFPTRAPAEYYLGGARAWKLGWPAKLIDTLKFLALGPALIALVAVVRDRRRDPVRVLLDVLVLAALVSALMPAPTWRQYLAPVLPPLFARAALVIAARPPGRATQRLTALFVIAGLAPSLVALAGLARGVPMVEAMRDSRAIGAALDQVGSTGPVATLSPQFLPAAGRAADSRFAAGPFYFRSHALLPPAQEPALHAVSGDRLGWLGTPAAILLGGEGAWTSGDAALERPLGAWARAHRYRLMPVPGGRFRLYVRPR